MEACGVTGTLSFLFSVLVKDGRVSLTHVSGWLRKEKGGRQSIMMFYCSLPDCKIIGCSLFFFCGPPGSDPRRNNGKGASLYFVER